VPRPKLFTSAASRRRIYVNQAGRMVRHTWSTAADGEMQMRHPDGHPSTLAYGQHRTAEQKHARMRCARPQTFRRSSPKKTQQLSHLPFDPTNRDASALRRLAMPPCRAWSEPGLLALHQSHRKCRAALGPKVICLSSSSGRASQTPFPLP
jgi:hypothetical protein